jgi:hypothetical protein
MKPFGGNAGSLFSVKAFNLEVSKWFGAFTGINRGAWYQEHELEHHNKLGRQVVPA